MNKKNCRLNHLGRNRITESNFSMQCRYHLTPCDKLFRNPNYPGHMKQRKCFSDGLNYHREEKHKVEVKDMTSAGALNSRIICSCERGNDCSTNNIKEQKQQHIQNKKGLVKTP